MSKSYERTILGRTIRAYVSSFTGEPGYERGWHGRAALYLDESCRRNFSVEYHVPSKRFGASFRAGHGESPIGASLNIGLLGVYVSGEHPSLNGLRDLVVRMWPLEKQAYSFSGRDFSISLHDHGVFWRIGGDDMGWSSSTPRWRDGAWHPLGHYMRQGEPELVEEREVLVPMPERSYRAKARLERTRRGFGKLPRTFDRVDYHVTLEMLPGEQIPFPGKGENSYDCGEDAAFGMSAPGRTIEDGVGALIASVLRDRHRRGGANWAPERRPEESK